MEKLGKNACVGGRLTGKFKVGLGVNLESFRTMTSH